MQLDKKIITEESYSDYDKTGDSKKTFVFKLASIAW